MRGKWAKGIVPRNFRWILKDQLAICERPGGYGSNHRRVRRQEEIIWIRENDFTYVVSLIPAPHNLHNYDELGMRWLHWPISSSDDLPRTLPSLYEKIADHLAQGDKLILHRDEVGEVIAGVMAGYLLWKGLIQTPPEAILVIEQMLERQMGPRAREFVAISASLTGPS